MTHPRTPALVRPLQDFLATETSSGAVLLAAAALALFWANLPGDSYGELWNQHVRADLGIIDINHSLRDWINDGLMAMFFFVVGLEVKREMLYGELAGARRAALPVAAALGGMIVPALIFVAINAGGEGLRGWGIPMATDIAFAAGVLALLGTRIPGALKVLLLAIAIVDDIGAILVIAIFYSSSIDLTWLAVATAAIALTAAFGRISVRSPLLFAGLGLLAWAAMSESGVHATIAGVAMAFALPAMPYHRDAVPDHAVTLERLEHLLHPWSSFAIVPLFALANAGVDLGGGALTDAFTSPVTTGIVVGLVLGNPIGITAASFVAVRLHVAALPEGLGWNDVARMAVLCGIGFTVSVFIAGLAFENPAQIDEAKIGILAGSLISGAAGYALLRSARLRSAR